ncbi:MAG: hypothetical protein B7Y46_15885 [Acidovorax sp. 28-64-14]|uniref:hypothetical protein n=1 Tax=Acidovorax sp. 28-64-14 TaxID=1970310 RepID=UPI000BC7AD92|nr:hypothetical protein [Acidovorax sp. 28-64-14]OYY27110.1 MAG: hypothetical protein B7Y64_13045 [Acidovorax sp. 35-64-16]OYY83304.1 MAG: hypothetical protein B7Y46_15885 [Acidovorax sp. 28-64-14]OZA68608.1 MAG: hypothetical protein B7X70_13815 [Acidovorax sp. 39-64-12]
MLTSLFWRHRVLGPVHPLDALGLLGIGQLGGEQAKPMEIQERIEVFHAEDVEALGVALRNLLVAKELPHYRAVLGLHQTVVVAVPRAAAGELDA